jgi:hypothetical protein
MRKEKISTAKAEAKPGKAPAALDDDIPFGMAWE